MLTTEAYSSNLESKLLVAVAKVCCSHIYNREQLCRGGVNLKNCPFLTFAELASIMYCMDEGAFGLCQFLIIAAPEAEGMLVGAGCAVKPACRVLAGVGEALFGCGTQ